VQVRALDPRDTATAVDLFDQPPEQRRRLNQAADKINNRYGEFTLAPARLMHRSSMPNVIAPAWKPFGHRETILDNQG
jgi:DNA polymerase-4